MGYLIFTKHHSYRMEDTRLNDVKILSGGKFHQNEILLLDAVGPNKRISFQFTDNPCNQSTNHLPTYFDTVSVVVTPYIQVARPFIETAKPVAHAGQFIVDDNSGSDIAKEIQTHLFHGKSQIFVTPTIYNDGLPSECTVIFYGYNPYLIYNRITKDITSLNNDIHCSELLFVEEAQFQHMLKQCANISCDNYAFQ